MPNFTDNYRQLPESLQRLLQHVVRQLNPKKIILFGSRARGDNRENSDFDIAVSGAIAPETWSKLIVDLEELNFSLYKIDFVQLEQLSNAYVSNIEREGKIIYG